MSYGAKGTATSLETLVWPSLRLWRSMKPHSLRLPMTRYAVLSTATFMKAVFVKKGYVKRK